MTVQLFLVLRQFWLQDQVFKDQNILFYNISPNNMYIIIKAPKKQMYKTLNYQNSYLSTLKKKRSISNIVPYTSYKQKQHQTFLNVQPQCHKIIPFTRVNIYDQSLPDQQNQFQNMFKTLQARKCLTYRLKNQKDFTRMKTQSINKNNQQKNPKTKKVIYLRHKFKRNYSKVSQIQKISQLDISQIKIDSRPSTALQNYSHSTMTIDKKFRSKSTVTAGSRKIKIVKKDSFLSPW